MDDLAGRLYQSISKANDVRVFERWHASAIAECPRAQFYKRLAVAPIQTVGAGKMLRWKAGHLFEEALRPHLLELYPDLVSNQRLESEKLDLTGEYDNYSKKHELLIEDKTVHDFAFQNRKKGDSRFRLRDDKPYLNHEIQNHCYVLLLREQGQKVSSITYIYITLDGRIATYKTLVKPDLIANVRRRLEILNKAWQSQEPPDCVCNERHPLWKSTMQYCEFREGKECCSLNLLKAGSPDPEWSVV